MESSTTLFKAGALQLPIALAVAGLATKISSATTILVMSGALTGFGLTTSSDTGLLVSFATAQFIFGAGCVEMGIRNVFFNDNQRLPDLRF